MTDQVASLKIGVDGSDAKRGINEIKDAVHGVAVEADKASQATGKIGTGAVASTDKATAATARYEAQLKRLNLELEAGGKNTTAYIEGRAKLAGADVAALAPLIKRNQELRDVQALANAEFTKSGKALTEYGMGVKATSAALRQVPAQFTDIIVSLQGGQAPLTVLLQQGGQLKDVFGGVGNAFKALSSYVLGLINPFTIAAGAATVLGVAYMKGAAEAEAYNKSLIMTGNAAGTTAGRLSTMAKAVSEASGNTTANVASVMAQLVSAGGVAEAQFRRIADTAASFERVAGVAVAETVKQFSELGKDPVKASEKLNESTHYLTAEIYNQIKALEDQGDKLGAAAIAQRAYADALDDRIPKLQDNLGLLEKAWKGITSTAKGAWDAMLGIGRGSTTNALLEKAQDQYNNAVNTGASDAELESLKARIEYYQRMIASEGTVAAYQADRIKRDEAGIALAKERDKYLTKEEKFRREMTQLRAEFDRSGKTEADTANFAKAAAGAAAMFNGTEKVKKGVDEAAKGLALYNDLVDKASGFEANWAENANLLRKALDGKKISQEQFDVAVVASYERQPGYIAAEKERAAAIKEAGKAYEDSAKASIKYYEGMAKDNASLEKSNEKLKEEVEAIGMSASAKERLNEARSQAAIVIAQEQLALMNLQNSSEMEIQQAERQIELLKEQASLRRQGVVRTEADDLAKANKKAAEESSKYWEDALMRAFESGKGFFESLWSTIKNTLKTQVLKVLVTGTLSGLGLSGAAAAGGSSGGVLDLVNGASNLNTLYGAGSQYLFGGTAGASSASLLAGNVAGMAGGDALGTMIAANGNWAGVATAASESAAAWAAAAAVESNALLAMQAGATAAEAAAAASAAGAAGGAGSSAAAGLGATGYGLIAAAAIAAIMYVTSRGETRSGATYTTGANGLAMVAEGPSGGEIAAEASRAIFNNTQASINATLAAVGSKATITGFTAGLESSENGKGFAFAGGMVGDVGVGEYKGRNGGQFAMSDLSPQQAFAAYVTQMNQVTLEALQAAADVPALIAKELSGVDISKLDAAGVTELTTTVQSVIGAVNVFRSSLLTLPFKALHDLSFQAAAGLVDAAGGFEALTQNLSGFYDNFYTESEKTANLTRNVTDAMAAQNIVLPQVDTNLRAWYRAQVESAMALDQSIPANQQYLASLLSIQSGVNTLATTAESAAQRIVDAAAKLMGDIYSAQDDAFSEYLAAQSEYNDMISADQQAAAEAMSNAAEALKDALASAGQGIVQFIQSLLNTPTNAAANYRNDLALARAGDVEASKRLPTSGRAYLDTQINSSATAVDAARATAKMVQELNALPAVKSYEQQLLEAVGGTTSAVGGTTDAIKDMNAKIKAELTLDARSEILKIINLTVLDNTLTPEQKALALAETAQIDKLIKLSSNNLFSAVDQQLALATTGTVAKTFTAALGAHDFDAMAIAYAQSSTIEKVIRASGGVLTLDQQKLLDGITQYNKEIQIGVKIDSSQLTEFQQTLMAIFGTIDITGLAASGVDLSSVISQEALARLQSVNTYVQSMDWVNTDMATRAAQMHAVRTTAIAYGVSSEDVATAIGVTKNTLEGWYAALNVPFFAKGSNWIPNDTLAMVHEGERIIPAADNRELMSRLQDPQQNSEALVAEIKALRDDNAAQARAMVQLQQRLTKLMERWNSDGMPSTRIEV